MKKKTIILAVCAAVLVLVMLTVYVASGRSAVSGTKTITVEVEHLNSDGSCFEIKTGAEFLRKALEDSKLISGSETEYGLWVETVDGETADASAEEWWGYTVNGEFAVYGVDSQPINDGDIYVFTLNTGY